MRGWRRQDAKKWLAPFSSSRFSDRSRNGCSILTAAQEALLTRDGLRGLIEQGLQTLPLKKGQTAVTPLGPWAAPSMPATWHWEWKHGHRWRPEPLWNRIALHAAFGTRDEARAALAQARAISKQVPAVLKPLIASLDAK